MPTDSGTRKGESERKSEKVDGQQGHPGHWQLPAPPHVAMPGGTAGNLIWWGGLAAVAALGVVDWPVAALVAAGTWVAERQAERSLRTRAAAAA